MMPLFYFILINKLIAHVTDAFVRPQPRFDNKEMFSASTFNSGDIRKTVPSSVAVRLIEPIGNGTFGEVYWAEDIVSGEMFVAKSARATTPGALAQKNAKSYLEIESYINSKLLRPRSSKDAVYQKHLAPFLGETEINKTRYLIWHKSGEYTLEDYIEMDDGWVQLAKDLRLGDCNRVLLHQKLAKEVLRQLLEGVAYCHSLGVIHRDIKPANVLVDPKTNTLRLIDFGSACDMSGWTSKAGYRGQNKGPRSILYCAPEEFIDEENPYAFDVYGVAVTWLRTILSEDEILNNETDTRQSSFGLGNEENLFKWRLAVRDFSHCLVSWEEYAVLHNEVPFGWDCLFGSSREGIHALRLLSSMMNYSPGNRISASEALLGPYLNADCNAELPPELPPAMPWSLSSHVQRWKKEREVQHEECRLEDLFTDVVAVELEFPLGIIFETQKGGGVKVAGIESKAELTQKMVREGDTLLAIGSLDVEGASFEHIKELLDQWGADKITVPLLLVRASGYSG